MFNIPLDVDVDYHKNRIFITIPRFDKGRPISLGTLDEEGRVNAYPDYSWHDKQGQNCDGITSAFRTAIDKCNRLWVIDSGKIEKMYCTPQLLAFDLNTDRLIYRHRISGSGYTAKSLFIVPIVDTRYDDCSNTFVYIADVKEFTLTVVDVDRNVSWYISHRLFYPHPSSGSFSINGTTFDLMDGLFSLALSPIIDGDRKLYFHALASVTENVVSTTLIRDSKFLDNPVAKPDDIKVLPGHRPSQSAMEAMDSKGILFFSITNPPSIWCWNSNTQFSSKNLYPIDINNDTLQFGGGLKIITNGSGEEELWVLTNRFQRAKAGIMNGNETNFRILSGSLLKLLRNSPCSPNKHA